MNEESEFEKWVREHFKKYQHPSDRLAAELGARDARDWFLAKAKELSWEEGFNTNLSLEDLEKACK